MLTLLGAWRRRESSQQRRNLLMPEFCSPDWLYVTSNEAHVQHLCIDWIPLLCIR